MGESLWFFNVLPTPWLEANVYDCSSVGIPSIPAMATIDTLKDLAAAQFGRALDEIDENTPIDQLGIDSLGFLEFLFELEDKLGLPIPTESVQHVRTLRELAVAIDELLVAKAGQTQ